MLNFIRTKMVVNILNLYHLSFPRIFHMSRTHLLNHWVINVPNSHTSICSNYIGKHPFSWVYSRLTLNVILDLGYCSIQASVSTQRGKRWGGCLCAFFAVVIPFIRFSKSILSLLQFHQNVSLRVIWLPTPLLYLF